MSLPTTAAAIADEERRVGLVFPPAMRNRLMRTAARSAGHIARENGDRELTAAARLVVDTFVEGFGILPWAIHPRHPSADDPNLG